MPKTAIYNILLLLAACTSPPNTCPKVQPRHYTTLQQEQIAAEHNALPSDDIMRDVLSEWQSYRAAAK